MSRAVLPSVHAPAAPISLLGQLSLPKGLAGGGSQLHTNPAPLDGEGLQGWTVIVGFFPCNPGGEGEGSGQPLLSQRDLVAGRRGPGRRGLLSSGTAREPSQVVPAAAYRDD